jgi:hypothetical protein
MHKIELPLGKRGSVSVEAKRILCNNVIFKGEYNPHNVRLWVCMNEYGPMGAVWATGIQEALDELVDQDLAHGILVDEKTLKDLTPEEEDELAHLGNAGEACDLSNTAVEPVVFDPARDWLLLCKFAEARGAGHDNLDF